MMHDSSRLACHLVPSSKVIYQNPNAGLVTTIGPSAVVLPRVQYRTYLPSTNVSARNVRLSQAAPSCSASPTVSMPNADHQCDTRAVHMAQPVTMEVT